MLIQALDEADPLMGFFVAWLKRFALHSTFVLACGLRVSSPAPSIAPNVEVVALRKTGSVSKIEVIRNLFFIAWNRRRDYDVVYIRGDAQYAAIAGWLWKLMGKKVVLWYAHHVSNYYLSFASFFLDAAITSVPEGYPYFRPKPMIVGQSIDESVFPFSAHQDGCRIVVFGRVMPSKYIHEIINDFKSIDYQDKSLEIVGPPSHEEYSKQIQKQIALTPGTHWSMKGVAYRDVPSILSQYNILMNANVGSLDKCIVESMMVGVIPIAASGGYARCLPEHLLWLHAATNKERQAALIKILSLSSDERRVLALQLRDFAIREHSLNQQINKIAKILTI